jgi:hypothetical protein
MRAAAKIKITQGGTMAEVFDIKTKKRKAITLEEYMRTLDTLEFYIGESRRQRGNDKLYQVTLDVIKEIRFVAHFNAPFREQTRDVLRGIVDEMYLYVNGENP